MLWVIVSAPKVEKRLKNGSHTQNAGTYSKWVTNSKMGHKCGHILKMGHKHRWDEGGVRRGYPPPKEKKMALPLP